MKIFNRGIKVTSDEGLTLKDGGKVGSSSHVVKFFKIGTEITTTALPGLAVGDKVLSVLTNGTATVALCATVNTLPADPADTTYLIVFRAVV